MTANASEPANTAATTPPGPSAWQLDPSGSSVTFTHKHTWGLATVHGRFTELDGSGEVGADGSGQGLLEIRAASVDTKNTRRDEHLRSAQFFDAQAHPLIVADVTSAVPAGPGRARVTGTLTVAGKTRPLELTATVADVSDKAVTVSAEADFNRADFGITWNMVGMIQGLAHLAVVARFTRA